MIENLQHIDLFLFKLINQGIANPFLDKIMVLTTNQQNWDLLYIALFIWLLWKGGRNGRIFALILAVTILIADQTSSSLIKPLVDRIRPCHTLSGSDIRLLVNCGAGKSFPSSHAVTTFAAAMTLGAFFKHYKILFLVLAAIISISRVYVGVHYPFDVLSGTAIGIVIGWIMAKVYNYILDRLQKKSSRSAGA